MKIKIGRLICLLCAAASVFISASSCSRELPTHQNPLPPQQTEGDDSSSGGQSDGEPAGPPPEDGQVNPSEDEGIQNPPDEEDKDEDIPGEDGDSPEGEGNPPDEETEDEDLPDDGQDESGEDGNSPDDGGNPPDEGTEDEESPDDGQTEPGEDGDPSGDEGNPPDEDEPPQTVPEEPEGGGDETGDDEPEPSEPVSLSYDFSQHRGGVIPSGTSLVEGYVRVDCPDGCPGLTVGEYKNPAYSACACLTQKSGESLVVTLPSPARITLVVAALNITGSTLCIEGNGESLSFALEAPSNQQGQRYECTEISFELQGGEYTIFSSKGTAGVMALSIAFGK